MMPLRDKKHGAFDAVALDELAASRWAHRQDANSEGAEPLPTGPSTLAHGVLDFPPVDVQLTGSLVVALAALPYVVEILMQVPLLTRVMSALPSEVRAELPPHPRRPRLAVFGSARFFLALFRYALRTDPRDPGHIVTLKRKMRASVIREALFGLVFMITVVVAWRHGWRPLGRDLRAPDPGGVLGSELRPLHRLLAGN